MAKAAKRGGGRARPQAASNEKKRAGPALSEDMYDEVDTFNMNRDKIKLDANESDTDEEESEPEAVLDLPDFDDSSDESEDDEDDEDNEDESDRVDDKAWGTKKSMYYSTDYIDEDLGSDFGKSDEEAEEEEKEALRLQKEQAAMFDEDDFFGAPDITAPKTAKDKKTAESAKAVADDLDDIRIGQGAEVVTITRDVAGMSQDEKLELLMNESPELLELLSDFRETVAHLRAELQPVVSAGASYPGRSQAGKHADYIDTKYQLLLSYCVNISYYLLLKARGRAVKDHPVIRQLVEQRELIGKLRAVDAEVSNQMAALRAAVAAGPIAARQNDAAKIDKPIRSARSLDKQANTSEKRAGKTSESKGRRARSRDATAVGAAPKRGFAKPSKVGMESSEFVPGEGKKRKVVAKVQKGALVDYGETVGDAAELTGKRRARATKLEHVANQGRQPKDMRSAESDVPRKQPQAAPTGRGGDALQFDDDGSDGYDELPATKRKGTGFQFDLGDDMAGENQDELDEYYNSVREGRKKRKQDRDEAHQRTADYLPEEEAEEKRGINWQMQKNKGLTPHRSKVNNPRVKHKIKFQKAKIKRKHQVKQYTPGSAGGYSGETSGLKKNLARSVRL